MLFWIQPYMRPRKPETFALKPWQHSMKSSSYLSTADVTCACFRYSCVGSAVRKALPDRRQAPPAFRVSQINFWPWLRGDVSRLDILINTTYKASLACVSRLKTLTSFVNTGNYLASKFWLVSRELSRIMLNLHKSHTETVKVLETRKFREYIDLIKPLIYTN